MSALGSTELWTRDPTPNQLEEKDQYYRSAFDHYKYVGHSGMCVPPHYLNSTHKNQERS